MVKDKLESLRNSINAIIEEEYSYNPELLLAKSQELDKLILELMKIQKFCKMIVGVAVMNELEIIIDKIQLFEKIYESMRIVDPVSKKVYDIIKGQIYDRDIACHDFWEKRMICENCISIRAYNENDTYYKMENRDREVFMVTAIPVTIQDKRLVVELIKNVTKSMCVPSAGKYDIGVSILSSIEHMNSEAVIDDLTKLHNRRFINERLPADLLSSHIQETPLSVIFVDLDDFKRINDTYGHTFGDQVLREVSEVLSANIGKDQSWTARYGGEEFLVCLTNTDYDEAKSVAERIRKGIAEREFVYEHEKVHITSSFGVHTVCDENACMTVEGIIELADKKLYEAKRTGKNKVL